MRVREWLGDRPLTKMLLELLHPGEGIDLPFSPVGNYCHRSEELKATAVDVSTSRYLR